MKKLLTGLIVLVCLSLLGGCGETADKTISVGMAAVRVDVFNNGYATVGVVKPETQVEVVSKYSGTVERTFKETGDTVLAGDILLQLDTTPVMNQIKSAQAALDQTNVAVTQTRLQYKTALDNARIIYDSAQLAQQLAQSDYENMKILFEAGAVAKSALDSAQSVLDKADAAFASAETALDSAQKNFDIYTRDISEQAGAGAQNESAVGGAEAAVNVIQTQLEILRSQMDDYTITSPIDGVIINKNAVAGGMIGQTPVYTVADIDKVNISTAVPKEEINKLSLGGNVQVFYNDHSSVETPITAISNSANAANLYVVQVDVDNKDHLFKPGMNAKMVFVESREKNIIVPFNSVVSAGKDNYIFIIENDQAKKVFVKVLGKNSDEISIEPIDANLNEKVQVATHNAGLLKDGDSVKKEN